MQTIHCRFLQLYERVEYEATSTLSNHLNKLSGHFIERTDSEHGLNSGRSRPSKVVAIGPLTDLARQYRIISVGIYYVGDDPLE